MLHTSYLVNICTLGSVQVLYKHVRGEGSEGNAYFAYVDTGGGLEAKCLYCLCKG